MRNWSARFLFITFIAASLITSSTGESPAESLTETENSYAELMDASSILAAIDSGLFVSYRGKGRAAWKQIQEERYKVVAARLATVSAKELSATDARAVMLMRKGIASTSDQASLKHNMHCKDAQDSNLNSADLRSALYSCFDELGNNLEFEGKHVSRVSAFDLLTQINEPLRRKALFMSFVSLWRAVNGSDEPAE